MLNPPSAVLQMAVARQRYPCPRGHEVCLPVGVTCITSVNAICRYIVDYGCGSEREVDPDEFARAADFAREHLDRQQQGRLGFLYEPTIDPGPDAWEPAGGVLVEEIVPHLTSRIDRATAAIDRAIGGRDETGDDRQGTDQ